MGNRVLIVIVVVFGLCRPAFCQEVAVTAYRMKDTGNRLFVGPDPNNLSNLFSLLREENVQAALGMTSHQIESLLESVRKIEQQLLDVDQLIEALKPVHQKYGSGDRRHVLIHGQFIRSDQLDSLKELQVVPSLFPMHTFYWGDWYDQIIGPELAQKISPMRSAIKIGMTPTSHTDAPVALPNLMQVMSATVNRVSRSGKVMGPDERLTPLEALKSITIWGAYQHFEEKTKGSLEVGKLADMVILDRNPLAVDPLTIKDIKVVETIKEGKTVYTVK